MEKDPPGIAEQAEQIERDLSGIRRALRGPLATEIAKGEMTVPQRAVMQVVVGNEGISLRDLSREVSLAHSTVSGIVDRLEKRGMIERRTDPQDGRISRIFPTAAVAQFVKERIPVLIRGPLEKALERATASDRVEIAQGVRKLRELLAEE